MEITNLTIHGLQITSIFTGDKYYFHSFYYGFIAIAERTSDNINEGTASFDLRVGNKHLNGYSLTTDRIVTGVKRFINRAENQFINKEISYNIIPEDLNRVSISIEEHAL